MSFIGCFYSFCCFCLVFFLAGQVLSFFLGCWGVFGMFSRMFLGFVPGIARNDVWILQDRSSSNLSNVSFVKTDTFFQ